MSIIFLGDAAFFGILSTRWECNENRFKSVSPILQQASMVFANLEVPVRVDDSVNEYKKFAHYSLPGPTEQLLKLLNIGCVSLANNHIYDCKMPGLRATIGILDRLGICHTGAGWLPEHCEPVVIDGREKIGFVAYVDKSTNPKTETFSELYINYFEKERVIQDVKSIRRRVDKVVCSIHWGTDYSFYPTTQQVSIAHELIDAGVDVLMGHHPHTLQPYERYKESAIFYSLGGLTFGDYVKDGKDELQALFRKTKKGLIAKYCPVSNAFEFIPTLERKGNFIEITRRDYRRWSNRKWRLFALKHRNAYTAMAFEFKEKVLDRVYEYFFGYYKNPLKRLIQVGNIPKIVRLFRGLKVKTNCK